MSTTEALPDLPPLPAVDYDAGWHRQYTADQMRDYARAALAATSAPSEPACQACGGPATRHVPSDATDHPGAYCDGCGPGAHVDPAHLAAYEQGVAAMAESLARILAGERWLDSSPPELAEVARRLAAQPEAPAEPKLSEKAWTNNRMNPWVCTLTPHQARRVGKTGEEVGELGAVLGRLNIQGLHEIDPSSGKTNFQRFWEESADVEAQAICNRKAFNFPQEEYAARVARKIEMMGEWEAHYSDETATQPKTTR